ncbi:ATP-binding cassette domain-containing protein [Cryobacterium lactosi]|uniref:ATP-binding cassette domain-containing protein n=1 Tax=Cryobacterium lactosi TaxID=1259202 RepID=A0A4R9BJ54_9MICO|nr:ATP-binding cassette domain-containing protein [Cryobacterium lactosi]TFD85458.1 ATP-binding cassette domain-containing protein [Cryobacterium lactosi]
MRAVVWPRWLGLLILLSLVACPVIITWSLAGPDTALLGSLSERLPFAAAGTVVAPILSGLLGVGSGLLVTRRRGWADQRFRALILAGGAVCLLWLTLVSVFWFAVQGEILPLLADEPAAHAGLDTLNTLLIPSTIAVFGGAVAVAVHVRAATRIMVTEGHVQTARSRGLPTTWPILRRVIRRTLPAIVAVQLVEFLVFYGGSLTVQAALATPLPAADLPPLLPAESLPIVLGSILLGAVGFVMAGVALATSTPAPVVDTLRRTSAADSGLAALLAVPGITSPRPSPPRPSLTKPTLASTGFRAADFLDIRDLRTRTTGEGLQREPLDGVSLTLPRGQTLAVIGDDPDGTSLLCQSIAGMQHLRHTAMSGSILFDGIELVGLPERDFRHLRGQRIGFLPAPAADHFDPNARIGQHLVTLVTRRTETPRSQARSAALALMAQVGLDDAEKVFAAYPGETPTATCQRVLLAGALVGGPQLVVADDPTRGFTAGDEAEFLDLLHSLQQERGFTLIIVSPRVEIAVRCDRVAIMSHGAIVEYASVPELLTAPQHPHTQRLVARGAPESNGP